MLQSHVREGGSGAEGGGQLFYLQLEFFCVQLSFFAYGPLRPLLDTLPSVSKKAPTVSKIMLKL